MYVVAEILPDLSAGALDRCPRQTPATTQDEADLATRISPQGANEGAS